MIREFIDFSIDLASICHTFFASLLHAEFHFVQRMGGVLWDFETEISFARNKINLFQSYMIFFFYTCNALWDIIHMKILYYSIERSTFNEQWFSHDALWMLRILKHLAFPWIPLHSLSVSGFFSFGFAHFFPSICFKQTFWILLHKKYGCHEDFFRNHSFEFFTIISS